MRIYVALLLGCGLYLSSPPTLADATKSSSDEACPPPKAFAAPGFPPDLLRRGASGSVELELHVDTCGQVIHAGVLKGSQHAQFNDSAIASVQGAVLNAAQMATVQEGRFRLQIDFRKPTEIIPRRLDWPSTHRRPRYLVDEQPLGFDSVSAAGDAMSESADHPWLSPYPGHLSRVVQLGDEGEREFWLFLKRNPSVTVVRYRPVMEEGLPVVRVAMLCEESREECEQTREMLMRGLPFARARSRGR